MKNVFLSLFTLLMVLSLSTQSQAQLLNGGFEDVSSPCFPQNGHYLSAFIDGCTQPWVCYSGTPTVDIQNISGNGTAFEGDHFAHLQANNDHEAIYYPNFDITSNPSYDFSIALRSEQGPIEYYILAIDVFLPDCGALGNFIEPSVESGQMIASGIIDESEGWQVISVENIVFDLSLFAGPTTNLIIYPKRISGTGGPNILYVDAVTYEEATCEGICTEINDLTACAEEEDFGFIYLKCPGTGLQFDWSFPAGSNAIEVTTSNESVVFQAGEGTYSVTITDPFGCTSVETYEILADCCEVVGACTLPAPQNLYCEYTDGFVKFFWDPVPGATGYEVQIDLNGAACCSGLGVSWVPIMVPSAKYFLPSENYQGCLSWRVRALCNEQEAGPYSAVHCYTHYQCFFPHREEQEEKKQGSFHESLSPKVFPNPASGEVNLQMDAPGDLTLALEIYDTTGKLIKSIEEANYPGGAFYTTWQLGQGISDGIYLVLFKTNYGTFQEKVVIQK